MVAVLNDGGRSGNGMIVVDSVDRPSQIPDDGHNSDECLVDLESSKRNETNEGETETYV